jgi:hypothetical protein
MSTPDPTSSPTTPTGTPDTTTTPTTPPTGTPATTTAASPTPPYNLILALAVVFLSTVIFGIVMAIFKDTFTEAALVTTALSTLFGIFGTVVGAYFGIKSTNDTNDKARDEVTKAHDQANQFAAIANPEEAKQVLGI